MAFPIGYRIGRYVVADTLGAGGMGEVYLVREDLTGTTWALKTLRAGTAEDVLLQRLMNEGRTQAELKHPNVAAFREMFLHEGRPCIVMEFVDGDTVFERVRRHGPFAVNDALATLWRVCDALAYLHSCGILHRDLKSANIKINSSGQVKLLDFGIAKKQRTPGITQVGAVMGTPEYLAPELLMGVPAGVRSEIWGIGLLGYEMLTGRLPFEESDEFALYEAIRGREPVSPARLNPACPPPVSALVMKCLEKNPDQRFQRPEDLQSAIGHILNPVAAGPGVAETALAALRRIPRRTRAVVGGILAAIVLLGVIGNLVSGPSGSRTITVEVVDGSADVYENGTRVGRTPYRKAVHEGEAVQLELRREGYLSQPVQFDVTERKVYSYTMQRVSNP